jgi:hypothetical protein
VTGPQSSFFDELERHLDRAARRGARYGRLAYAPRASGPVVAALVVALVVILGGLAIPRAGHEEVPAGPQLTATPPPAATATPDDFGCGGGIHPETLAAYPVLNRPPDPAAAERLTPPEGIVFRSGPVLAREAFGHRFWLIAAATPPDCSQPLVCLATDFVVDAVQCSAVDPKRSTMLLSRVDPKPAAGAENLVVFAAAPEPLAGKSLTLPTDPPIEASVQGNVLVGAARMPEAQARMNAERLMEQQVP